MKDEKLTDKTADEPLESALLSDGPPLAIVLNLKAGNDDSEERIALISRLLEDAGRPHQLFMPDDPTQLPDKIRQALAWAQQRKGALVAAGGDGTINTVAHAAVPNGCPLGVLPQGTFNYFGRAHGIPADIEQAMQILLKARPRPIQVGLLNDRIFLVNASLGLYPKLLEDREEFKKHLGRSQFAAMVAAFWTILRSHHDWLIELESEGKAVTAHTRTLFVGNNQLQLEQIGIPEASEADRGKLVAVMVKPAGRLAMLALTLRGALGQLGDADQVRHFAFTKLIVRPRIGSRVRHIQVATDGELLRLTTPLVFSVNPIPLQLLAPPDSGPA